MWRRLSQTVFTIIALAGLSACATTYEYYGDERYHEPAGDVAYDGGADDGGYAYSGSAGSAGSGGYDDGGYGYYADPDWYAYPAYYSMFWSLNRWYVDPYWHPSFYYGVTWFPRHYYAISFRSWPRYGGYSAWPPYYRYVPYSPYRGAWFDYYYDWTPWYAHHPHFRHHYAPRYGNVRHETERLTNWTRRGDSYERWRIDDRRIPLRDQPERLGDVRDRNAQYRGATTANDGGRRVDPGVRGFSDRDSTRSSGQPGSSARIDPNVRGFGSADRGATSQPLPTKPQRDARGTHRATEPSTRDASRPPASDRNDTGYRPIVRRDSTPANNASSQRSDTTIVPYGRGTSTPRGGYENDRSSAYERPSTVRRDDSGQRWSVPAPASRAPTPRAVEPTPSYRQPTEPRGGQAPRGLVRSSEPTRGVAPAPRNDYSRPGRSEPARPQFEQRAPAAERAPPQRAEPQPERGGREARSDEDDGRSSRERR